MKKRGVAHALFLLFLLVVLALFLSAFLFTCFQKPQQKPEPITPIVQVQSPHVPEESKPTAVIPKLTQKPSVPLKRTFTSVAHVEPDVKPIKKMPLPVHLISLPVIPKTYIPKEKQVAVPAVPVFKATAKSAVMVPQPPYIFEPQVLTEEDYDMFYPPVQEAQPKNDDFWADFFVVGQDKTVAYDDGFYYLSLYVNDEMVGDIEVQFLGEQRLVNASELSSYVGEYITKAASNRIFGDGKQYLSLEDLQGRGVKATYDSVKFAVYLTFSLEDMPERTVSITAASINRREQYGMSGAIVLKPAKFALASSLSLYTVFDYPSDFSSLNSYLASLSVSNRVSMFGIGLNFYFSLSSRAPYFTPGSWSGFYDFVDSDHRLSFGNVGTNLSSLSTSANLGFTFEKNYAYGTGSAKGNQFEHTIVLVEPSQVQIEMNGEKVFDRHFQAGTYRLKDFVFTQGANQIKISTIPDARPDDIHIEYVDLGYDYRLLGKGDSLYGFGFSIPKEVSATKSGTINIPWVGNQYLAYYPDRFTATYYQQTGLTDTFTFTTELAFTPGIFSGTLNGVLATLVGTTQLQLSLGLDDSMKTPSFGVSLSHRVSGKPGSSFGTFSTTLNHMVPAMAVGGSYSSLSSLSLSYSGSLTDTVRYTLSGNLLYDTSIGSPSWNLSFATGFSPFKGFSISGSLTASGTAAAPLSPSVSAQISGSYSFSPKLSANTSTSLQSGTPFFNGTSTSSLGVSYRPSNNNSLNLSVSSFEFSTPLDHSVVGTWSHSGELASFALRQQITNSYQDMSTTLTANTSFAYADGAFGIAKSVNEAFLLVKPVGDLQKSEISIARSLDSAPSHLPRPLGSALYNSISTNTKNTVVVFSSGPTEYSTGSSFVYEITPRSRQSFVAKLQTEPAFTVSGVLKKTDGQPYVQYSSPVYQVSLDSNGKEELIRDDSLYLFTDQEGRFILSEVKSGTYLFDLQVEDLWYAVRFTVPEVDAKTLGLDRVLLLEDFWVSDPAFQKRIIVKDALTGSQLASQEDVFGTQLATGYDAEVTLDVVDRIDEQTFWNIIFPPFNESDFNFASLDNQFVTQADYQFDSKTFDQLVGNPEPDPNATQVVTAAP